MLETTASNSLGHQALTALGTATALTLPTDAQKVMLSAQTQNVRIRFDGVDPTASTGIRLIKDTAPVLFEGDLSRIRVIEETAGGALYVAYFD